LTGKGFGYVLLSKLIAYCRARGTAQLIGDVLAGNTRMLGLAAALGFDAKHLSDGTIRVTLELA
jgi:acetyltransferase